MYDPRKPGPIQTELGTITHHIFVLGRHTYRHLLGRPDEIEVFVTGKLPWSLTKENGWQPVEQARQAA